MSHVSTKKKRSTRINIRKYERMHDSHSYESITAPINGRLNVVVRSPAPFGLGRNGCWPSRGSQLPGHSPSFFRYAAP